jgi:multiple sugar transport system permease protein
LSEVPPLARRRRNFAPYGFLLPSLITILIVIVGPLVLAWVVSFHDVDLVRNQGRFVFFGLGNYRRLLADARAGKSILNTLYYVVVAVSFETLLGLSVALFLNRKFTGKSVVRTLILIPNFITPVVGSLMWRMFYEPTSGIINYYLRIFGLPIRPDWLGSTQLAMPSIILVDAWMGTAFITIILVASLEAIPIELYEAAHADGASEWKCIAGTLKTIDALKAFDIIYVLTQGGPGGVSETTNLYAYIVGFKYFQIGYATTIALVFTLVITTIAGIVISRVLNRVAVQS